MRKILETHFIDAVVFHCAIAIAIDKKNVSMTSEWSQPTACEQQVHALFALIISP